MAGSRQILEAITADLKAFIEPQISGVVYENYFMELRRMELRRSDIPRGRISVYEQGDNNQILVDAYRTLETQQRYAFDIYHVLSYSEDSSDKSELPLMELKDLVWEWINTVDINAVSGGRLISIQWAGTNTPNRGEKLSGITINVICRRCFYASEEDQN